MEKITIEMLNEDVIIGKYLDIPLKITLNNGKEILGKIDLYTHDEEPFINYIYTNSTLIPFEDIEEIIVTNSLRVM